MGFSCLYSIYIALSTRSFLLQREALSAGENVEYSVDVQAAYDAGISVVSKIEVQVTGSEPTSISFIEALVCCHPRGELYSFPRVSY